MSSTHDTPHRRFNPLTREWVLVSPNRAKRPWQGEVEDAPQDTPPRYDPHCYLCPGNERAGGRVNPPYTGTFVFDNDFAALRPDVAEAETNDEGLLIASIERGICRVVCFSPRHDLTLARMTVAEIRPVIDVWADQYQELGALDFIDHVQIFENRGAMMGASNPHPHCQIWAQQHIPNEAATEIAAQSAYFGEHHNSLLSDYLTLELQRAERVIDVNEHFVSLVPFWAVWPFETLIISRRQVGSLVELNDTERDALADLLRRATTRYDNLFHVSFPYTMGWHQRPTDGGAYDGFHLHAHFYPPLLRSANVRKFMVGYEMLGMPQRDITAEEAAQRLREQSTTHYLDGSSA